MSKLGYKGHDKRTAEEIKRAQTLASKGLSEAFKDGADISLKVNDDNLGVVNLEFRNGLLVTNVNKQIETNMPGSVQQIANSIETQNTISDQSKTILESINTIASSIQSLNESINNILYNGVLTTVETDSFYNDAFQRRRVSNPDTRFDAEFLYGLNPLLFDATTSSGTITFDGDKRQAKLQVTAATADKYAELTQKRPNIYTAGNSQLIAITSVLNGGALLGDVEIFLRSKISGSVVETVYERSEFLYDQLRDVNWSYSQIFEIDFQSLKVGRIRFGLNSNGVYRRVHQITNDNIRNSGYWQLASAPLYFRIYNDSSAEFTYTEIGYGDLNNAIGFRFKTEITTNQFMNAICCTVKSEGGGKLSELSGLPFTANNDVTERTVAATMVPILGIQPKTTFNSYVNRGIAIPITMEITTTNTIWWKLLLNPTTSSGGSWVSVDDNSLMNYNVYAGVSTETVSGGIVIASGYATSNSNKATAEPRGITDKEVLGVNFRGTASDQLVLVAVRTTASSADVTASINWKEVR